MPRVVARLVSVAVPVPFLGLLTYSVPDSLDLPPPGARVVVPLGPRVITGCVVSRDAAGEPENVREVLDVLDAEAYVPPAVVDLALWVAEYYAAGPGEAIALGMPPYAHVEGERLVTITDRGRARLERVDDRRSSMRDRVLCALASGRSVGVGRLAKLAQRAPAGRRVRGAAALRPARDDRNEPRGAALFGEPADRAGSDGDGSIHVDVDESVRPDPVEGRAPGAPAAAGRSATMPIVALTRGLERDGLVTVTQALRGSAERHKTIGIAALTVAGHEWLEGDPPADLGVRQREALAALRVAPEGVAIHELADRGIALETLKRLVRRELVVLRRSRVDRDPFERASGAVPSDAKPMARDLTPAQQAAFDAIVPLTAGGFHVALLHGVTGSGKTEIYLRLAARTLAEGRTVLVLVPEIALTPAVAALFRAAFGDRVAIQHSGLSDGERYDQWHRIRRGEIAVVVGTRSAVFAPIAGLGLIVVDEEHDSSYKQDESPRYHGRDVAVMRGKRDGALVVLGSATPSMESFHNALTGRYAHVSLPSRVLERPLAAVRIVNMRDEYAARGPDAILSDALKTALDRRLRAREQALLLLNRRGLASAVYCRQCGATLECPNCSLSLIVHAEPDGGRRAAESTTQAGAPFSGRRRARCHYCNYSRMVPARCDGCAGPYLDHLGFGTVRVEQEVAAQFPQARVARLDRDASRRRGAIATLLERFGAGEIDVLVGTQMIAKGHDFPRVTLVGVISADVGLGLADFRAAERTFQLLTQVAGRAGRGEQRGEAIVQTLFPDHYSIRLACRQDYRAFFDEEMKFRRAMRYPPLVSLVNTIVRAPTFSRAFQEAEDLAEALRRESEGRFRVLGPAPAPLGRLRGEHRVQFFLKGTRRSEMRAALMAALAERPEVRRRVNVDVDPISML